MLSEADKLYSEFSGGQDLQHDLKMIRERALEKRANREALKSETTIETEYASPRIKRLAEDVRAKQALSKEKKDIKFKIRLESKPDSTASEVIEGLTRPFRSSGGRVSREKPASFKRGYGSNVLKGVKGLVGAFMPQEEQRMPNELKMQMRLERQRQQFALRMMKARMKAQAQRRANLNRQPPSDHVRNFNGPDETDRWLAEERPLSLPEEMWGIRRGTDGQKHGPLWSDPRSNILNSPNVFNQTTAFSRFGQGFRNFINNQMRPAPPLSAGMGQSNRITLLANGQQTFREARQQAPRILRERPEENILNAQRLRW